jgi:hypothetical protein
VLYVPVAAVMVVGAALEKGLAGGEVRPEAERCFCRARKKPGGIIWRGVSTKD